jgi:predicted RNA-binding Zn-ribbon protein involved in translation (DUF1610 family)
MTLICPNCKGKDIDFQGIPGTEEPRYVCKACGYAGPLVLEEDVTHAEEGPDEIHEDILLCPNCGSEDIVSTIPDNAQGIFQPRYRCRKCGYTGSTALKKDSAAGGATGFPYTEIMVFFFLSVAWYVVGAGLNFSLLFFVMPSTVIIFFRYLLGGGHTYSVEDDLKSLNEDGTLKKP